MTNNYETDTLSIWIANEEDQYLNWQFQARNALEDNNNDKEDATLELAKALKEDTEANAPEIGNSFYNDVLWSAIKEVDYYAIAEEIIEDVYEKTEVDEVS